MARFIFNQEVKHEANHYQPGDIVTLPDDTAAYFASNLWGDIEGQESYDGDPIINPEIEPIASKPIVDTVLEVHSSVLGVKDTNNG